MSAVTECKSLRYYENGYDQENPSDVTLRTRVSRLPQVRLGQLQQKSEKGHCTREELQELVTLESLYPHAARIKPAKPSMARTYCFVISCMVLPFIFWRIFK